MSLTLWTVVIIAGRTTATAFAEHITAPKRIVGVRVA